MQTLGFTAATYRQLRSRSNRCSKSVLRLATHSASLAVTLVLATSLGADGQQASTKLQPAASSRAQNSPPSIENYSRLPLRFEINQGQSDPHVRFLSRGFDYTLFLTGSSAVLALQQGAAAAANAAPVSATRMPTHKSDAAKTDVLRMKLAGAHENVRVSGINRLSGTVNYFIGNDPAKWHSGVPTYAGVKYSGVYTGIDLVYHGNPQQLEYDFIVAPGSNPSTIRLRFEGAQKVALGGDGELTVRARNGNITFLKPQTYQIKDGKRQPVEGQFRLLADNSVGFAFGNYDHSRSLIVDPTLTYSTYLGGSTNTEGTAVAADASGNAYVTGATRDVDFPTTPGAYPSPVKDSSGSPLKVFVTKLNATGTAELYSTYFGGSGQSGNGDNAASIALDANGNAYIAGATNSNNFPTTTGAYQTTNKTYASGGSAPFVTKLNPTGTALVYSTYVSGSGDANGDGDGASGIAVDSSFNAYIAGTTYSEDFPNTPGVFQTGNNAYNNASSNAFVTKLNAAGSGLVYSTYLGGTVSNQTTDGDQGNDIAVDGSGDAYVVGEVSSTDFPVRGKPYQGINNGTLNQVSNAFLSEISPTGSTLLYSTYLGGAGVVNSNGAFGDVASGVSIDSGGNAYIAGQAYSTKFPTTPGAFQTTNNAATSQLTNAFVTKLNPSTGLVYSTYLGGTGGYFEGFAPFGDFAYRIANDSAGNAYITGLAASSNFPVTSTTAYQPSNNAAKNKTMNAFITELNPTGSGLVYSTYLGGTGTPFALEGATYYFGDYGLGIAVDSADNFYSPGIAYSSNFPVTTGAFQQSNNAVKGGGPNAFIVKFTPGSGSQKPATTTTLTSSGDPEPLGTKVTFTAYVQPNSGDGIPTGTVVFSVGAGSPQTVALDSTAHATFTTSDFVVGKNTVAANYSGDNNFESSAASFPETIIGPAASIAVSSISNNQSTIYGSPFYFPLYVTVSDSADDPVSGVTVKFSGSGVKLSSSSATTDIYGDADVTATAIATGNLSVTASVAGVTKAASFALSGVKVPLTVTANNASVPYDQPLPAFSYGVSGFVNGDTSKVLSGAPAETTTAKQGSLPGSYPITITQGSLTASNYTFATFINGELTIAYLGTAATPTFSPIAGTYNTAQKVAISAATPASTIYYTTNYVPPTTSSTKYTVPLTVSANETVEAIAVAPGYMQSSFEASNYVFQTAKPAFNPAPGDYSTAQTVSITDATPGASIFYTTNGTSPTTSSTKYTAPIKVTSSTSINAIAFESGYTQSAVATGGYVIEPLAPTPKLSLPSGAYSTAQTITISDSVSTLPIYYTTNGTTPTAASAKYTLPIVISAPMTVKAIAIGTGYLPSAVISATYDIAVPAPPPAFSPLPGTYTTAQKVTITGASGTTIHYTSNGTAPTASSSAYTAPIAIAATTTLEAFAVGGGYLSGPVATAVYTINPSAFTGMISTVAGEGSQGYSGDLGPALKATLNYPSGIAEDASGNLYIADADNNVVRKVSASGVISTFAGNGNDDYLGDGGLATSASLSFPNSVAVDASGNVYIADSGNSVIRKVTAKAIITTIAGNGDFGYSGDGGLATNATLDYPQAVALDSTGDLYIADTYNNLIRKVSTSGIITTFAGNGADGYSGDGGVATNATLSGPGGVALDGAGNVFIADTENSVVRKVTAKGIITTIAGNGDYGYSGDGGAATKAMLSSPTAVAVTSADEVYIADSENNVIRAVSSGGIIQTVAGNGNEAYSGDGGPAINASLSLPNGVALDSTGNFYVGDSNNNVIRKIVPAASNAGLIHSKPIIRRYPASPPI